MISRRDELWTRVVFITKMIYDRFVELLGQYAKSCQSPIVPNTRARSHS